MAEENVVPLGQTEQAPPVEGQGQLPAELPGAGRGVFEFLKRIGEGEFGEVWRARDTRLQRVVAIKLLKNIADQTAIVLDHARLLARVEHRNVVRVYEVTTIEHPDTKGLVPCIVMELIDGVPLKELLKIHPPPDADRARKIGEALLDGLAAIHKSGIPHADLHDGNVIVIDDEARIIDVQRFPTQLKTADRAYLMESDVWDARVLLSRLAVSAGLPHDHLPALDRAATLDQLVSAWRALSTPSAQSAPNSTSASSPALAQPRVEFDEAGYLSGLGRVDGRALAASPAELPTNVQLASAADPLASRKEGFSDPKGSSDVDAVDACMGVQKGELLLITGPGGAGKSTVLQMALDRSAARRRADAAAPLPIFVHLGAYRGSLRALIEDELGVRVGHWELIPGPILLLCDGLNELGLKDAAKVVAELSTYLKRGRVAIVITMRATGLPGPVVFPATSKALRLHPFTFRDVRSMAAEVLDTAASISFLSEFRKRFNFAGGSLFTLPFGVVMLLRSFKGKRRFPANTRELVADVIERRYEVNEEIFSRRDSPAHLARSTLVRLAQFVAEDLRLARNRTRATREELEEAIHASVSALRAAGAFGADELKDSVALDALLAYEVILERKRAIYQFEHEIIAGYLVSAKLGREWSSYTSLLEERNLDEAWLLAAHEVPPAEHERFFSTLCGVNAVLAAHAALDTGRGAPIVESILLERLMTGDQSIVTRWETYMALAVLATPASMAALKRVRDMKRPKTNDHHSASLALCLAGDRETLKEALVEVDRTQHLPGIRVSGGAVTWWNAAPADVALRLARERIKEAKDQYLAASLSTIALYGDSTDVPGLLRVIATTTELYTALRAYNTAAEFDEEQARSALHAKTASSSPSVRVRVRMEIGVSEDDAEWLLDVVLQPRDGEDADEDPFASQNALKLLAKVALPETTRSRVRAAYDGADEHLRGGLWAIASDHKLASFEPLAVEVLRSASLMEVGYAANFAIDYRWQDERLHEEFEQLASSAAEEGKFAYDWNEWRLLAYLLASGKREAAAQALDDRLRALLEAWRAHRRGIRPALLCRGADILSNTKDEHVKYDISNAVARILEEAAAVADLLPRDLVLGLLEVDLRGHATRPALLTLVASIEAEAIDEVLRGIDDEIVKTEVACMLARLGPTETRLEIIANGFERFLASPPLMTELLPAAEALWSDAMLGRIVNAITRGWAYLQSGSSVRESALQSIGRLVTRAQAREIVAPAMAQVQFPGLYRLFELWYEMALRRRDG